MYAPNNPIYHRIWEKEIGELIDDITQQKAMLLKGRAVQ
jgi:hypothetical protein